MKILGIGLGRMGTRSLYMALEIPGTPFPKTNVFGESDCATVMKMMNVERGQVTTG